VGTKQEPYNKSSTTARLNNQQRHLSTNEPEHEKTASAERRNNMMKLD